jgi:Leucine-rich repeat (LRR) protein
MWINGLTTLTLDYNNISNFLWVCRMQELNSLSAKENVGFISTDYMENMGRLHSLDLSGTDGVDLERVAEMPELKQLVLGYAQDLSALSENTSIEKLTVITGADGVRGIAQMKALTEIKLTLMQTADLSDLSILGYLEKLELSNESGTEVSLSVVSEITNLSKLALGTGSFTDYSAIARNPAITSVYVPYGDDEKYKCVGKYFPMDWILRYAVS